MTNVLWQLNAVRTFVMVRGRGFEPPRINHTHLKRARLPVPPPSHTVLFSQPWNLWGERPWCGLLEYITTFPADSQALFLFLNEIFGRSFLNNMLVEMHGWVWYYITNYFCSVVLAAGKKMIRIRRKCISVQGADRPIFWKEFEWTQEWTRKKKMWS